MRLYQLGMIRSDGGAIFVLDDAPAFAGVEWSLTGNGTLTPITTRTNLNGVATARYDAAGSTPGDQITVEAEVYA